jgi:hypothetical protein
LSVLLSGKEEEEEEEEEWGGSEREFFLAVFFFFQAAGLAFEWTICGMYFYPNYYTAPSPPLSISLCDGPAVPPQALLPENE